MAARRHHSEATESRIRSHGIRSGRRAQAVPRDRGIRTGARGIFLTFAARLTSWYDGAKRDLPWRKTRDPYRILVSEIMLQQTRAQAVIPYYEKFLERFPTVHDLARAAETEVLHGWSGLGYYARARNLQKAARQIVERGAFPKEYGAIRALPGVGTYTAAAVASIAFGGNRAVVDGNVMRVIARLSADAADIGAQSTKL